MNYQEKQEWRRKQKAMPKWSIRRFQNPQQLDKQKYAQSVEVKSTILEDAINATIADGANADE